MKTRTTWFLIMGSVFPSKLKISRVYDLKGSRYGRQASKKDKEKENCCYKDLDFINHDMKIEVGEELAEKMKKQIAKDAELLCRQRIIDYSMLIGVHYPDTKYTRNKDKKKNTASTTITTTTPGSIPTTPVSPHLQIKDRNCSSTVEGENSEISTLDLSSASFQSNNTSSNDLQTTSPKSNSQVDVSEWKSNFNKLKTDLSKLMELSEADLAQISEKDFIKKARNNPLAGSLYYDLQRFKIGKARGDNSYKSFVPSHLANVPSPISSKKIDGCVSTDDVPEHLLLKLNTTFERPMFEQEELFANEYGGIVSKKGDKIYFLGIIDTLIIYTLKKKMETTYKSTVLPVEREAISVVPPDTYSARFQAFMKRSIC